MKKVIAAALLAAASLGASAHTYWYYGTLYGNICRAGYWWNAVPYQPVGSSCMVRDGWGGWWHGFITNE